MEFIRNVADLLGLREQTQTEVSTPRPPVYGPNAWDWNLVQFDQLPDFLKDNEYIHKAHRPQLPSITQCVASAFVWHSETINIWSHMLGSLGCLLMIIYDLKYSTLEIHQQICFFPFFAASVLCLLFSGLYHWFNVYSPSAYRILSRLDYGGIIFLVVASLMPWIFYAFVCYPVLQIGYLVKITTVGLISFYALTIEQFYSSEYRPFRAVLFVSIGLTGVVPSLHYIVLVMERDSLHKITSFGFWFLLSAATVLSGGYLYAIRFPEQRWPGRFDFVGSSHQMLHILVLVSVLCCYVGVSKFASHAYDDNFLCEKGPK